MAPKPNICEVIYCFELAGSEVLAADLIRHWKRSAFNVIAIGTHRGPGPLSEQLAEEGVPCYALDLESASLLGKVLFHFKLWRIFRRHSIDVVHVHHMAFQRDIHWAARFAGVRQIVVTEHTNKEMLEDTSYFRVSKRMAGLADKISVIHPLLRDYFVSEFDVGRDKVRLIPNGVDTNIFAPSSDNSAARRALGIPVGTIALLWVGRFEDDKDPMNMINAFGSFAEDLRRRCTLVMVGAGALFGECQRFVLEQEWSDAVRLTGRLTNINEVMRAADLFVLSSKTEGFPLVLLEAMSSGVACVTTDVGGITALVGNSVSSVPARSSRDLALAVEDMIAADSRRELMGKAGRQLVLERFDAAKMRRDYTELLQE